MAAHEWSFLAPVGHDAAHRCLACGLERRHCRWPSGVIRPGHLEHRLPPAEVWVPRGEAGPCRPAGAQEDPPG